MTLIDAAIKELVHIRPMNDSVVVLPIVDSTELAQTESGIWVDVRSSTGGVALPDTVENEPIEGRVVALGPGVRFELPSWMAEKIAARLVSGAFWLPEADKPDALARATAFVVSVAAEPRPFQVKVGDRILWTPWSAFTITLDGVAYNIISEEDIIGIVEEPPAK